VKYSLFGPHLSTASLFDGPQSVVEYR